MPGMSDEKPGELPVTWCVVLRPWTLGFANSGKRQSYFVSEYTSWADNYGEVDISSIQSAGADSRLSSLPTFGSVPKPEMFQ